MFLVFGILALDFIYTYENYGLGLQRVKINDMSKYLHYILVEQL